MQADLAFSNSATDMTILNPLKWSRRTKSWSRVGYGLTQTLLIDYMYLEISFYVGRIRTARLAGSKLIFFDIVQNDHKIQAMWNLRMSADVTPEKFKQLYRLLRRGDAFCM